MKLGALKEYIRRKSSPEIGEIDEYLRGELMATLRELRAVFNRITFVDNFEAFIAKDIVIPVYDAGNPGQEEVGIPNKIAKPVKYWMPLKKNAGGIYVCNGDTAWTTKTLYLKNTSTTEEATLTAVFFN